MTEQQSDFSPHFTSSCWTTVMEREEEVKIFSGPLSKFPVIVLSSVIYAMRWTIKIQGNQLCEVKRRNTVPTRHPFVLHSLPIGLLGTHFPNQVSKCPVQTKLHQSKAHINPVANKPPILNQNRRFLRHEYKSTTTALGFLMFTSQQLIFLHRLKI